MSKVNLSEEMNIIWLELVQEGKFDIIEMLRKVEKGEYKGKTIKIFKPFLRNPSSNIIINHYLKVNDVLIRDLSMGSVLSDSLTQDIESKKGNS